MKLQARNRLYEVTIDELISAYYVVRILTMVMMIKYVLYVAR